MGLNSVLAGAIDAGFKALGASQEDGLQKSISYFRLVSQGSYDTVLRKKVPVETTTTFDAIKYKIRDREIDGIKILINDARIIFPSALISFIPSQDDRLIIGLDEFNIVNVIPDPSGATWTLHIRGV